MDITSKPLTSLLKGEVYAGVVSMARKTIDFSTTVKTNYPKWIPVGIVTETGKYVPANPVAKDGSEITVGILLKSIAETEEAGTVSAEILTGNCAICPDYIDWSMSSWTDEQKKNALEELEAAQFKMVKEV